MNPSRAHRGVLVSAVVWTAALAGLSLAGAREAPRSRRPVSETLTARASTTGTGPATERRPGERSESQTPAGQLRSTSLGPSAVLRDAKDAGADAGLIADRGQLLPLPAGTNLGAAPIRCPRPAPRATTGRPRAPPA